MFTLREEPVKAALFATASLMVTITCIVVSTIRTSTAVT